MPFPFVIASIRPVCTYFLPFTENCRLFGAIKHIQAFSSNAYPRMSTIIFITFFNIEIFYSFSLSYVVLWRGL